jgi:hypothetical protein
MSFLSIKGIQLDFFNNKHIDCFGLIFGKYLVSCSNDLDDNNDLGSSETEEVGSFSNGTQIKDKIKNQVNFLKRQLLRMLALKGLREMDDENNELEKRYILLPRIGNAKRSFYLPRIGKKQLSDVYEMEKRTFLKPRVGK